MKHFVIVCLIFAVLLSLIGCSYTIPKVDREPEDATLSRAEDPLEDTVVESGMYKEETDEVSEDLYLIDETSTELIEEPPVNSYILATKFPYIFQEPELPTGCEVTSLAMVLEYYECPINKVELARKYLPKESLTIKNSTLYGPDPKETFVGNPEEIGAYGCYAPCIAKTANAYFEDNDIDKIAVNVSGTPLEDLLTKYVDNNIPIIIWVTSKELHEPEPSTKWTLPDGSNFQWLSYEHCVVLRGSNIACGLVYVSDPMAGQTMYDYALFGQRYEEMGMQAVVILDKNQYIQSTPM